MKITNNSLGCTFGALAPGDVFSAIFKGNAVIAMKLEKPEMEENAVGLADGAVYHLDSDELVCPEYAELIVRK